MDALRNGHFTSRFLPRAVCCTKGLSDWLCPSVSQSVMQKIGIDTLYTLQKLMQFTVSTIPEFSYYQFRKVHHFRSVMPIHNNYFIVTCYSESIQETEPVLSMT